MSDSVRPHRWEPTRLLCPWDSSGKNTGVGCHLLLQFMKVKSQSEVAKSCPTLSDPMDCSLPGSSIHGIFQCGGIIAYCDARSLEIPDSVQFSRSVVSNSLRPHEPQHVRALCPSPTPGVHSDSRPSSQWYHPAISSLVVPFSSCPQSLLASKSFPMSQLFTWGGQRTGVSALTSFFPKKSQGWSPSEWTGWISLPLLLQAGIPLKKWSSHHNQQKSLKCSTIYIGHNFSSKE